MPSSKFFDVVVFPLLSLVTDSRFMSISLLVLELWQFSYKRDWPEIQKLEIPNIWRLGRVRDTKNSVWISPIKCYWMLQNARVTAFIVFELLRQNKQRGKIRVVGARQSFQFFRQTTWFLKNNRALSKILCGILHYLTSIIK